MSAATVTVEPVGREPVAQRVERGEAAGGVLLAVAAGKADAADDLAVNDDRETADEDREPSLEGQAGCRTPRCREAPGRSAAC